MCMSATGDTAALLQYFAPFDPKLVELPGQKGQLSVRYLTDVEKKDDSDWSRSAMRLILEIVKDPKHLARGDILLFCPGEAEIRQIEDDLATVRKIEPTLMQYIDTLTLYRDLPAHEQAHALQDRYSTVTEEDGRQRKVRWRKVILATNIAETSITFPRLDWVFDCGMEKVMSYNAEFGASELLMRPCGKSQSQQRAGRTGRTRPGTAIRLYSKAHYEARPDHPEPPILRMDLSPMLLLLWDHGIADAGPDHLDWPSEFESDSCRSQLIRSATNNRAACSWLRSSHSARFRPGSSVDRDG